MGGSGWDEDGGRQGGQIKRVIFVGTQPVIINVTDESASRGLCKLLRLGLQDNRLLRKMYGYSGPFFISRCRNNLSSGRSQTDLLALPPERREKKCSPPSRAIAILPAVNMHLFVAL